MTFVEFRSLHQAHVDKMLTSGSRLFVADVDRDLLWETYLGSFPESERQEHNCNSCRQFIKNYGAMVTINDKMELETIWDFDCEGSFGTVTRSLSALVRSFPIKNIFISLPRQRKFGTLFNHQKLEDLSIRRWDHLHVEIPASINMVQAREEDHARMHGDFMSTKGVLKRALDEITDDAIDIVMDLIKQKSLYRGEEHLNMVSILNSFKKDYNKLTSPGQKDNYAWLMTATQSPAACRVRNTSIGTLLVDISEGVELDTAVRSFETKMAPANYKRPNAIFSTRDVENATKRLEELGLSSALHRRHAIVDDIDVKNVIFVNRDTKKSTNPLELLKDDVNVNPREYSKIEEITADDFISKVIPTATMIEVLLENSHEGNLVNLVAPGDSSAGNMFKWDNGFSWSYNNQMADSIKERVKAAGGSVEGELRVSLSWHNRDDLDLHVSEPTGNEIFFARKVSGSTGGNLDVDMNVTSPVKNAVENIIWPDRGRMVNGKYNVWVNNYRKRDAIDTGFTVEVEHGGVTRVYDYGKPVANNESVQVAVINYKNGEVEITSSITAKDAAPVSRVIWGLNTNRFHKVSMIMNSPNHWNGHPVGNKHLFFMMEGVKNPSSPRGFFNEFLRDDLLKEKRVFEALGSKMKVEDSGNQLGGLGFSSTGKGSLVVRVSGSFKRTLRVTF